MSGGVLLGADLGTSGLKLVALDEEGTTLAEAERAYDVQRPHAGWAETDVGVWRTALDEALAEVTAALRGRRVLALGLSGQMHGAVLLDSAGNALRPALLWPDGRATAELDRWRDLPAADRAALANPLVAGMTGPMVAWLARHEPDVLARAAAVVLPKDALRASLVLGAARGVTDRSDASATLLWDVAGDTWSWSAVEAAGIPGALLPDVRPATEFVGTTAGGIPMVVGAADTPLALLAAGADRLQVNLGTGAQVLRPGISPRPVDAPLVHCYADVLDGWYAMAALRNGGSAWSWVRAVLGMSWSEFFAAAASVPTGAGGAVFTPFLQGERGGVAGPEDRGGWSGLHPGTTRADLARSAVEGVARAVAGACRLLGPLDDEAVVLTGGGARDAVVQQVLADALGRPVRHVRLRSASAVGAALLAARGIGLAVVPRRDVGPLVEPLLER